MRLLVFPLLLSTIAFCADRDFNGRWDITVLNEPKDRAWWLEVTGAGTPELKGRFVGFPGGNMEPIPQISIQNGELHFSVDKQKRHLEYTARLVNGKLEGTFHAPDQDLKWTGVRAELSHEKDDGTWREGKPIELFNHKDLTGWHVLIEGKESGWSVVNGVLTSTGRANNLVSDQKFWNFKLHVEYNVGPKSNSGVGLRGRYEVQILDDYGQAPNLHMNGALYSRIQPPVNASKRAGEWQTFDIRLVGQQVTIVLNDQKIIDKQMIDGLTAIATDPHEGQPGPIVLQGDHGPVEFRSLILTLLTK